MLRNDARSCPTDGETAEEVEKLPKDTRLGNYKIERMLGEGGMGFVYEATHEVLNRRTAIKLLRPELATHDQVVTRFLNEAKAVNLIDHQHIINVYDYGDGADGSVYFVMEFLEGETLDDLMRKKRPLPLPLLLHVFGQIAKALAAAHAKQIVHRDLKPANVYVIAREDNPVFIKLLDFGIAQLRGEGAVKGLTQAGSIMGTPQYMSPEQITGGTVDARTDVWAMGVMIYRAATGQAPFKGEAFGDLAGKILQETPKAPREIVSEIPAELEKLIMSCLERSAGDRCQSIADLIAGLERVKTATKLDDEQILAAVKEDAGMPSDAAPPTISERTRKSIAGSLPEYQGVDPKLIDAARSGKLPATREAPPAAKSKAGMYAIAGLAVIGLGLGAAIAFGAFGGGGGKQTAAPTTPAIATPGSQAEKPATAAKKSPEASLRAALASPNLQLQGQAVDALARVRDPKTAPLLYVALKAGPELRVRSARALAELELPDAAPKVRAALAESGDKVKVELAAALVKLGDKDAMAILKRAVSDPGMKLAAAIALAGAGDEKTARPVLSELFEETPAGRDQWLRAAQALAALGDPKAQAALEAELAHVDPLRAVGAADALAKNLPKARAYLLRVAADAEFARRGEASVALARLGDGKALAWVPVGLKSADPEERKLAITVCALLHDTTRAGELAALADNDPDRSVQLTAAAALL